MDILTEIYITENIWDKIRQMDENAELHTDSIVILDCKLTVKLSSDGEGYVLKLIDK